MRGARDESTASAPPSRRGQPTGPSLIPRLARATGWRYFYEVHACRPFLRWLLALLLAASALPSVTHAQGARQLDDPTGITPVRPRPVEPAPATTGQQGPGFETAWGSAYDVPPAPAEGEAPDAPADAALQQRLRFLDASFALLSGQGPNYTSGVISLILGGVTIAFGAVFLDQGPPWDLFAPFMIASGSVAVLSTVITDFILRPNPEPVSLQYLAMSSGTRAERLAKLNYGEEQLASLAEQHLILRVVDASLAVAGAGVSVGAYLGLRPPGDFDAIELLFIAPAAITVIAALIGLFNESGAERRWSAYQRLRDSLSPEDRALLEMELRQEPSFSLRPLAGATSSGGMLGLTGSF